MYLYNQSNRRHNYRTRRHASSRDAEESPGHKSEGEVTDTGKIVSLLGGHIRFHSLGSSVNCGRPITHKKQHQGIDILPIPDTYMMREQPPPPPGLPPAATQRNDRRPSLEAYNVKPCHPNQRPQQQSTRTVFLEDSRQGSVCSSYPNPQRYYPHQSYSGDFSGRHSTASSYRQGEPSRSQSKLPT